MDDLSSGGIVCWIGRCLVSLSVQTLHEAHGRPEADYQPHAVFLDRFGAKGRTIGMDFQCPTKFFFRTRLGDNLLLPAMQPVLAFHCCKLGLFEKTIQRRILNHASPKSTESNSSIFNSLICS